MSDHEQRIPQPEDIDGMPWDDEKVACHLRDCRDVNAQEIGRVFLEALEDMEVYLRNQGIERG